jgi:hypothetical protein
MTALREPNSLTLLLSPTIRQSGELFREKVLVLWHKLGRPLKTSHPPTQLSLSLANGSRILALPDSHAGIVGYSDVDLIVLDEAAQVSDELYRAVRPMLAVSRGRLVALSTPFGQAGWFYDAWQSGGSDWQRAGVAAKDCPRISKEFLEKERQELGPRWFSMCYENVFLGLAGAVFDPSDIDAAIVRDLPVEGF